MVDHSLWLLLNTSQFTSIEPCSQFTMCTLFIYSLGGLLDEEVGFAFDDTSDIRDSDFSFE